MVTRDSSELRLNRALGVGTSALSNGQGTFVGPSPTSLGQACAAKCGDSAKRDLVIIEQAGQARGQKVLCSQAPALFLALSLCHWLPNFEFKMSTRLKKDGDLVRVDLGDRDRLREMADVGGAHALSRRLGWATRTTLRAIAGLRMRPSQVAHVEAFLAEEGEEGEGARGG